MFKKCLQGLLFATACLLFVVAIQMHQQSQYCDRDSSQLCRWNDNFYGWYYRDKLTQPDRQWPEAVALIKRCEADPQIFLKQQQAYLQSWQTRIMNETAVHNLWRSLFHDWLDVCDDYRGKFKLLPQLFLPLVDSENVNDQILAMEALIYFLDNSEDIKIHDALREDSYEVLSQSKLLRQFTRNAQLADYLIIYLARHSKGQPQLERWLKITETQNDSGNEKQKDNKKEKGIQQALVEQLIKLDHPAALPYVKARLLAAETQNTKQASPSLRKLITYMLTQMIDPELKGHFPVFHNMLKQLNEKVYTPNYDRSHLRTDDFLTVTEADRILLAEDSRPLTPLKKALIRYRIAIDYQSARPVLQQALEISAATSVRSALEKGLRDIDKLYLRLN